MTFLECMFGELDIDISLATASDAVQKNGVCATRLNIFNRAFLCTIKRVWLRLGGAIGEFRLCCAAFLGDTTREHGLNDARERTTIVICNPKESFN